MEGGVRLPDRRAVQAARRLLRLRARALHPRRGLRSRRPPRLQAALRQGLHLPRQLHGQLGPRLALGDLRPRGREPRGRGHPVLDRLPGRGRRPRADRGHGAPGDDAGRHGRRREPRRRALRRPPRLPLRPAPGRPPPADHRRRARRPRVRHRGAEDHARPRPQRLRDRAPPRARGDRRDRPRRAHERGGGALRRPHRGRGPGGGGRGAARAGPAARRAALRALGAVLPPLRRADRAADLAAVVLPHGRAGQAGDRGGRARPGPDRPRPVEAGLPRLDARDPALVRLAPALVGAPDPGLVLRRLRGDDRRRVRAAALRRLRRRAAPGGGRARHLVQLGDLALRDARLARGDARAARLLPDQLPHHRARDPLPLGGADDHDRDRVRRRRPLPRRLRPLGDPGPRRAAHVEEPRHRDRPAAGDRRARRRRAALRPAGDVLDPGRALLRRQGPAGRRPREQALEREPIDLAELQIPAGQSDPEATQGQGPASVRPRPVRVEDRWILSRLERTIASVTEKLEAYDFAHAVQECLRLPLARPLRLVPGDRQAAPLRRRGGGLRDPAAGAGAGAGAAAPDDAVRHRGDLVLPPGPARAPGRAPVPGRRGGAPRRGPPRPTSRAGSP